MWQMNIRKSLSVVAFVLGTVGSGRADEAPVVQRNGPICDNLPRELLEQSYIDRQALFEPGIAEKYGWRAHDAEFEAATGMGEYTFGQGPPLKVPLFYEEIVYQRTDVDANGKDEMVVFWAYIQGGEGRYRIETHLTLFCDRDNWRTAYCDSVAQNGGNRGSMQDLKYTAREPGFEWIKGLDQRKIEPTGGLGSYKYGAVFLPSEPLQTAENAPLSTEFSLLTQPIVALISLYSTNPENPDKGETFFGAELFGIHPDGLAQLAFCTWSY
jgi:hypothetical protein